MRRDSWFVELLDRLDNVKRELPRVTSGNLAWNTEQAVPGSGSLTWTQTAGLGIDWLNDRIRVTHIDATTDTPMGVFKPSMPGWEVDGPVTRSSIAMSDKTELLNSPLGDWLTLPKGTVVTTKVAEIVRARGGGATLSTDSTELLAKSMSWDPTATWLTVVNNLLKAINYAPLWADMTGRLVVAPFTPIPERLPVATYGAESDHLRLKPQWSDRADLYALPTGVRLYVSRGSSSKGFVGAADLPDAHPLSAASRGGVPYLLTESSDATTRAKAAALAQRRLDEVMQLARTITVTHPVDEVQVGDAVSHGPLGINAVVVQRGVTMGVGAVVSDTIQHTYTGGELPWPTI